MERVYGKIMLPNLEHLRLIRLRYLIMIVEEWVQRKRDPWLITNYRSGGLLKAEIVIWQFQKLEVIKVFRSIYNSVGKQCQIVSFVTAVECDLMIGVLEFCHLVSNSSNSPSKTCVVVHIILSITVTWREVDKFILETLIFYLVKKKKNCEFCSLRVEHSKTSQE